MRANVQLVKSNETHLIPLVDEQYNRLLDRMEELANQADQYGVHGLKLGRLIRKQIYCYPHPVLFRDMSITGKRRILPDLVEDVQYYKKQVEFEEWFHGAQ